MAPYVTANNPDVHATAGRSNTKLQHVYLFLLFICFLNNFCNRNTEE